MSNSQISLSLPTLEYEDLEIINKFYRLKQLELDIKANCVYIDGIEVWALVADIEEKSVHLKEHDDFRRIKGRLNNYYQWYQFMMLYPKMY